MFTLEVPAEQDVHVDELRARYVPATQPHDDAETALDEVKSELTELQLVVVQKKTL